MNIQLEQPFNLFTAEECQDLINRARELELKPGQVMASDPLRQRRNNNAYWITLTEPEYDRLWDITVPLRNQYNLTWMQKPIQISLYRTGEFYDWHPDVYYGNHRKSIRSLTLTCTLQKAAGAVLETRNGIYDLDQGQAIIFPADLEHRACAPTQGERWALTVWYMTPNLNVLG